MIRSAHGAPRIEDTVLQKRDEIRRIAERHGAYNVRLVGSVARGEAGPDSDVDLVVDVGPVVSSWFPGGLIVDLEALLGRRVDVITNIDRVHAVIREQMLADMVPL